MKARDPIPEDLRQRAGRQAEHNGPPLPADRVLLGEAITNGVEPPEEFEPDVLIKGAVHQVFAGPATGKTWLACLLISRAIERGQSVAFFDTENGKRIISERLATLGVDGRKVDESLWYFPSPSLGLDAKTTGTFAAFLDAAKVDLVVFDSWLDHLASAGLSENEATDIASWAARYSRPARERCCTVVILDHVPHGGAHARGSTRKKDEADVQWRLSNPLRFDRKTLGEIVLRREKDRQAWLPEAVRFSVGGTEDGFVFRRSSGTTELPESDCLTERQQRALEALKAFNDGATFTDWWRASGLAKSTFCDAKVHLEHTGKVEKHEDEGRYFTVCVLRGPQGPTGHPPDSAGPSRGEMSGLSGGSIRPPDRTSSNRPSPSGEGAPYS